MGRQNTKRRKKKQRKRLIRTMLHGLQMAVRSYLLNKRKIKRLEKSRQLSLQRRPKRRRRLSPPRTRNPPPRRKTVTIRLERENNNENLVIYNNIEKLSLT